MKTSDTPSRKLSASILRILLSLSLVAILAAGITGFIYAHQQLNGFAADISKMKVDAESSTSNLQKLRQVESDLATYDDVKATINQLRAPGEFPEFRVIDEITKIAGRNNIPIESYSYEDSSADTAQSGTTEQPPAATPTPSSPSPESATPSAPTASSKTISLTINFGTITSYNQYLQFLYDVEHNIPKMRINSVGINNGSAASDDGTTSSSGGFSVDPLTIELYIQ